MKEKNKIGLALSGGGYRAAAFHLGTLKKLDEMGILSMVDVLSTISGGSITGAAWCLHQGDYQGFHSKMKLDLEKKNVISEVFKSGTFIRFALFIFVFLSIAICLSFTSYAPLLFIDLGMLTYILLRFQYKIFPVSDVIENVYRRFFFGDATLSQLLDDRPKLAIGSSNLETGRPFTFSKDKMSDTGYSAKVEYEEPVQFLHENFPVARAVTASSCVPFAFSPIHVDGKFFKNSKDVERANPALIDGGVYDNQGLHKLTQENSGYACNIIITSDAGGSFLARRKYPNTLVLLIRTVDLFMYRIKTSQMQTHIYRNNQNRAKPISYFSLGWTLERCITGFVDNMVQNNILPEVLTMHRLEDEWIKEPHANRQRIIDHLKTITDFVTINSRSINPGEHQNAVKIGTNLTSLSPKEIGCLITHAENLTEIQVKLYCPMLVNNLKQT